VALVVMLVIVAFIVYFFWWIVVIAAVLALSYLGAKVWQYRSTQIASRAVTDTQIAARADQQNEQYLGGDLHGLYGIYTPAVPGSEAALTVPGMQRPLPGRKPTLQGELERQEITSDQHAIRGARQAAEGRVLIDQFVETVKQQGVPPETLYEESRGPTAWSYDKVAGTGWMLEDRGSERSHFEYYYILPGQGIAKVVRRLPDHTTIKALCYGTHPDNSEQAYSMWASRASQLAQQARHLIEATPAAEPDATHASPPPRCPADPV
jgi:hypothetical protein